MKKSARKIVGGLLLIAAAVALIFSQIGFGDIFCGFGFWEIVLLGVCAICVVYGIVDLNGWTLAYALGISYCVLDEHFGWPEINFWIMMIACTAVGLGISSIVGGVKRATRKNSSSYVTYDDVSGVYRSKDDDKVIIDVSAKDVDDETNAYEASDDETNADEDGNKREKNEDSYVSSDVVFGGSTRYVKSSNFSEGDFNVVFGGMEIYFDEAKLKDNHAKIDIESVFGKVKVFVPNDWNIIDDLNKVCGSIELGDAPFVENAPTLRITGDVVFGSVVVKRI